MTAALPLPAPGTLYLPNPAQLRASVARMRSLAAVPDALPPAREHRPVPGQPGDTPAQVEARRRFLDCSRGAHQWVHVPVLGGRTVCLHCPVPQDQAAAVAAARKMDR